MCTFNQDTLGTEGCGDFRGCNAQTEYLLCLLRCPAAVFSLTMCMLLVIVFFLYTWTNTNVPVYIHFAVSVQTCV